MFLFVHTYAVHFPYGAPAEYYAATQEAAGERTGFDRAYSASVRYADSQVGRLVEEIRRLGIASRTILIVTADHGEEFGEHGGSSHSHSVYDELLHVPLVWWGPGQIPAGRRVRTPTSLVDVVPTVLDLAGLPAPAVCDGESQVARIRGGPEDMERTVFAEVDVGPRNPYRRVACHTGDTKWIRSDSTPPSLVAFDLRTDAREQRPLEAPALVERGRVAIAWYETLGQEGRSATPEPVDPAMQERLRALGYAE